MHSPLRDRDEFLIAVPALDPTTAARDAAQLAEQLVASVGQPLRLAGRDLRVGVSLGISVYPQDGATFGALLHTADMRMYTAKHSDRVR